MGFFPILDRDLFKLVGSQFLKVNGMKLHTYGIGMALMLFMVSGALAQNDASLDAGRKIRDGGVAHGAQMYQRHARDYSHMLYYHGQGAAPVNPAQAQQYVSGIKKNVELSGKALKSVQAAHPNDAQVKKSVEQIETHLAKVNQHCDMLDKECQKANADGVKICDCCVDIDQELKAAQEATGTLLKHVKADLLPAPRKSTEKATPK